MREVQNEAMSSYEREYTGLGHATGEGTWDGPAYAGRGQAGDEVADALEADLAEEYGSDDPASAYAPHREGMREGVVGRLTEDFEALSSEHDDVTALDSGEDGDLSAEEAALHYVDPEYDPIPE